MDELESPTDQKPMETPNKDLLTEVKMSWMRKRVAAVNEKKTYQSMDTVTVLGLVYWKNGRVSGTWWWGCWRRERNQVTHVSEKELETAEGEGVGVDHGLCFLRNIVERWDQHVHVYV